MLLAVATNVMTFLPVLLFFIVVFAVAFSSLLQNQEPFSHVGLAIVKIMAMSIGELDFGDIFFDETNVKSHEIVAFLLFIVFLEIMTISMMNLLIGVAVGDIGELSEQGEQIAFKSKVDLILQYSFMFAGISNRIYSRKLVDVALWHAIDVASYYTCWENFRNILASPFGGGTSIDYDRLKSYQDNIEREHKKYLDNIDEDFEGSNIDKNISNKDGKSNGPDKADFDMSKVLDMFTSVQSELSAIRADQERMMAELINMRVEMKRSQ